MNALELADELKKQLTQTYIEKGFIKCAETILRQQEVEIERITSKYEEILHEQQVEIEALKAEIEELKLTKKVILRYAEKDIAKYRAEVEELKKQLALWRLSKSSEEIEQSNPTSVGGLDEPVAWMRKEDKDTFFSAIDHSLNSKWIPLFIHPADLTDEEIAEVYEKCEWASGYVYWKEFARAILRKAQEK